ncbi:MAG: universal stress protein [Dermatophilaceae bacterium]
MSTTSVTEQTVPMTSTSRPVVVGVDGSTASRAALAWAIQEAASAGRPLHVVHAHPVQAQWPDHYGVMSAPPPPREDTVLVDAVATAGDLADHHGVVATSTWGSGSAFLVEASAEASMVVVGAPHHGAVGSAVLGSTAVDVAARALSPVVVVRADRPVTTVSRGVVVGADGSDASRPAIEEAFRRADRLGLPVTVVHAWYLDYVGPGLLPPDVDAERRRLREQERALVADTVAAVASRYPGVTVQQEVVNGDPVRVLTEASSGAEVVIVGSHGRGEVSGLLLGSVSQGLIRHTSCPVMVVRPGTESR